jgi:acetyltransferase-like isoleucine patch superfamily enzyme
MVRDIPSKATFEPSITIHDGVHIGRFCQITCSNSITIEENVLITEGVLITDSIHSYDDIHTPIIKQSLGSLGPIVIGSGSWICNGARIFGKVRIGRNSVVGANSYVDKDVPDYCVVAGNPAKIIKRYDLHLKKWIRVEKLTTEVSEA